MSLEKIKSDRLQKLGHLQNSGVDPYPAQVARGRILVASALEKFAEYLGVKKEVCLAGRLRSVRLHGASAFVDLEDESDHLQLYFKKDELGEKDYNLFVDNLEAGDFIEAAGELFETQKGEKTLLVKKWKVLVKSLNQLPDKWHGLTDTEERFRRRYLDLLMNKESLGRFRRRSEINKHLRQFFDSQGFIEVETPILQNLPGGALAKPFKTHLNALDIDLYLRIAPELYLKRLIVGGFEKVYELGRCFRNEGMDKSHNPDFTILEFYWAYAAYERLMELTEELFEFLAPELEIEYQGNKINLTPPFKRISMRDLLLKELSIDIDKASQKDILKELTKRGINPEDDKDCRAVDALFKIVRPNLIEPTFVMDHPLEMSPLAKEKKDDEFKKRYAQRFQLIVGGLELVNAYSELNDPREQATRMKEQEKLHKEEVRYDEDFIEALEYGMPPTAGWGLGIDRLVMLLTDAPTLREVILFPTMKPEQKNVFQKVSISEKIEAMDLGINKKQANVLFGQYVKDSVAKKHSLESEAIMRALAKHFNADEENWGVIGLLHDLDWDLTKNNPKEHSIKTGEILKKAGASDFLVEIIQSHNYGWEGNDFLKFKKRTKLLEYALAAAETLSGLIAAAALISTDKKLNSLSLESLKKKFKDKKFAARCDRRIILECEKMELSIEEFLEIGLKAMQRIADDLGI